MSSLENTLCRWYLRGSRADEELGADLGVGVAIGRQPGHLRLLRGEDRARLHAAPPHRLARRLQLSAGPVRERQGPEPVEHLVGGPQVLAGVHAPLPATEPLAVEQVGPAQLHPHARSVEPLDRLAVQRLGGVAIGDEGAWIAPALRAPNRCPTRSPCQPADRRHPPQALAGRSGRRPRPVRPTPSWRPPTRPQRLAGPRRRHLRIGPARCRASLPPAGWRSTRSPRRASRPHPCRRRWPLRPRLRDPSTPQVPGHGMARAWPRSPLSPPRSRRRVPRPRQARPRTGGRTRAR